MDPKKTPYPMPESIPVPEPPRWRVNASLAIGFGLLVITSVVTFILSIGMAIENNLFVASYRLILVIGAITVVALGGLGSLAIFQKRRSKLIWAWVLAMSILTVLQFFGFSTLGYLLFSLLLSAMVLLGGFLVWRSA